MTLPPIDRDSAVDQLERVLSSEAFRGAARSSTMLRYLVERTLDGQARSLKEYTVGIDGLGKNGSFDPRTDPIVRAEASRLRSRLERYYATDGRSDSVVIELPKGTYVPLIQARSSAMPEVGDRRPADRQRSRASLAIAVLSAIALTSSALAAWAWLRTPSASPPPDKFVLTLPEGMNLSNYDIPPAVSRSGRDIFVGVQAGGTRSLARRRIGELDVHPVAGTENAAVPATSPDDRSLAFIADNWIRRVSVDGGKAIPLANVGSMRRGLAWGPNGTIVVGTGSKGEGLSFVPAAGGNLTPLTTLDASRGEMAHAWPIVLADGNTVIYTSWPSEGVRGARLAVTTLQSRGGDARILDVEGTSPLGVVERHLIYVNALGNLMAVPFDVRTRKTTGQPFAVLGGIGLNRRVGGARAALSASGTLVYIQEATQLVAVDLTGREYPITTQSANFDTPQWSPNGRHIAVQTSTARTADIDVYDVASGVLRTITNDGCSANPTWTARGDRVVFVSTCGQRSSVWTKAVEGGTPGEQLFESPNDAIGEARLTGDGRTLVYVTQPRFEIHTVRLADGHTSSPIPGAHVALSPSGKWMAYTTVEGTLVRIILRRFPASDSAPPVFVMYGWGPVWSPDGKTLYYWHRSKVFARDVTLEPSVAIGPERELPFAGFDITLVGGPANMSVSPDGKKFVLVKQPDQSMQVTTNWLTTFREQLRERAR